MIESDNVTDNLVFAVNSLTTLYQIRHFYLLAKWRPRCARRHARPSELNIWNDNIQSFRPETSEALVLVFHAVRTSVSVPRMQTVRGPYVSFSPLLGPLHGQYKFENK